MVFVGIAQERIADAVQEIRLAFGERHKVHIEDVESVVRLVLAFAPSIFPSCAGNDAGVFGSSLVAKRSGELGGGLNALLKAAFQKRRFKFGVHNAHLARIFRVVVVDESAHISGDAFVAHIKFGIEHFRAVKHIAVLIVDPGAKAQVAFAVSALERERNALRLIAL